MPVTKNRLIRLIALDKCFRNSGRKYFLDDLVDECCIALINENPCSSGISRRSVQDDIKFMKSESGYKAPIVSEIDNSDLKRRPFYFYENRSFSINNQPLNESEALQLKETLTLLNRFKGLPQMHWMDETVKRLKQTFHLEDSARIMSFEENPYLCGMDCLNELFHSIVYHKVLKVEWHSFQVGKCEARISPYILKQYNTRWFLFAQSHESGHIINVPLDRIIQFSESEDKYRTCEVDFDEYFEDVVGVSVPYDGVVEAIELEFSKELLPYIKTKPIHGSQKLKELPSGEGRVHLDLVVNYEFMALIRSFGVGVTVVSPVNLRRAIFKDIETLYLKYK